MTQHDYEMLVLGDNLGRDSAKSTKHTHKKSFRHFMVEAISLIAIMLFAFAIFCLIFNISFAEITYILSKLITKVGELL